MSHTMAGGVYSLQAAIGPAPGMDWKQAARLLAGPKADRSTMLRAVERATRLPARTCRALFDGEMTDPKHSVAVRVEMALAQAGLLARKGRDELERLDRQIAEQEQRIADLERALVRLVGAGA